MRRVIQGGLLLWMCGAILGGVPALAQSKSAEQEEIRAVLDAQVAAWNRGDIEGFMAGYWKSDETLFAGANGFSRGWQALLERYRKNYPDRKAMGKLSFTELEIHALSNDAAYIVGRWQLERESDRPGGVFTLIARRFPEGWRIVHDHTTAFAAAKKD
jgi:ketosteroid isomerase-like protein